ncbi:ATP-dependent DNA helicase 2 subunit KU80-like [Triticum dicoccoides]|uniref:ATP-dependent DNA helicase 2 subunit KU80-like n=1 Tax=Triticum dicoccoides TaxID=85692 RepID=UPI00188E6A23|nr:ATP-dependent DNA helicase 2 subunit KU80-like [Triticum dicoccoides]XP_037477340.1 ATP-dependent DNA helicase 2 subunit KU80-like [Triticum dicoccoides]
MEREGVGEREVEDGKRQRCRRPRVEEGTHLLSPRVDTEGLVLLLDVGPSMHRELQEVENVCTTLVRKKLVFHRSN